MRLLGKNKKITAILFVMLLAFVLVLGGCTKAEEVPQAPDPAMAQESEEAAPPVETAEEPQEAELPAAEEPQEEPPAPDETPQESVPAPVPPEPAPPEPVPAPQEEPVSGPQETPAPGAETPETPQEPQSASVTFSISCETALASEELDPAIREVLPADGWILGTITVEIEEGESVFDVLQRVCRDHGIAFEHSKSPIYDSAYIEGIGHLYEFDCGNLSGWEYSVNGWYPNYGCSKAYLSDGDVVCWKYTCDLGKDIGAY